MWSPSNLQKTTFSTPTGTGYVIYPTNYNDIQQIPAGGITVVFGEATQQDLLARYKTACDPNDISDPACIESLVEILEEQAPDLQKRLAPVAIAGFALFLAAYGIVTAILTQGFNNEQDPKPVGMILYPSSVIASMAALSTATGVNVIVVETTPGDTKAMTISSTELTSFNPSPTTSASFGYVH